MDDEEALRLNTLHRFAKHSSRLLLQEYSHCEVPAGCGGVVLRWLDPAEGVPVIVQVKTIGTCTSWIDGAQLSSGHMMLAPGAHVVAVHVTQVGRLRHKQVPVVQPCPFTMALVSDAERVERDLLATATLVKWRWTARDPSDSTWTTLSYDDTCWAPLGPGTEALRGVPESGQWGWDRVAGRGQAVFAITADEAWLRISFTVDRTSLRREEA